MKAKSRSESWRRSSPSISEPSGRIDLQALYLGSYLELDIGHALTDLRANLIGDINGRVRDEDESVLADDGAQRFQRLLGALMALGPQSACRARW